MRHTGLMYVAAVSTVCALLLAGCAQDASVSDVPAASSEQPGTSPTPGVSQLPSAAEGTGTVPGADNSCEGSPLGCSEFVSVRGTDATGAVAWLGTEPLRVSSRHANGQWTLFVMAPCNYLQVAVAVQGEVMRQLWMAVSDVGCVEPQVSYQLWTEKLFDQPVQWKLDGDSLTLSNSHATIELKES